MRRGRMHWQEEELSVADLAARRGRLQAAMAEAGLDGLLLYTNLVRPGAVHWVTGFTPYWAEALLLVGRDGAPLFATALSKRVGKWIAAMNPTADVEHSMRPGQLVGERLMQNGARRVGVVELDRLPGRHFQDLVDAAPVAVEDASRLFDGVRGTTDAAELGLARHADGIAREGLATVLTGAKRVGEVTGTAERAARLAGVEECYVAAAPDLGSDSRLARIAGTTPLAGRFAVRLSLAYRGVWVRRTETFDDDPAAAQSLQAMTAWCDTLAASLDPHAPFAAQVAAAPPPGGATLADWRVEAPHGTRPLRTVAGPDREPEVPPAYGVLTVRVDTAAGPWLGSRCVGVAGG